jgi:RimJ/RimL family protein N-acetyltransferase
MTQFERPLADAKDSGMNSDISYVMLDKTNLPTLVSQGLLPNGAYLSLIKKISNNRYETKRRQIFDGCNDRLLKGDVCIVGIHGDEAIGWVWVYADREKYEPAIETKLQVDPSSSIIYRWLVYPPYRGRGFGTLLLKHALYFLNNNNRLNAVIVVENDNLPSLRVTTRLGFKPTKSIKRTRLFGYSKLSVDNFAEVRA